MYNSTYYNNIYLLYIKIYDNITFITREKKTAHQNQKNKQKGLKNSPRHLYLTVLRRNIPCYERHQKYTSKIRKYCNIFHASLMILSISSTLHYIKWTNRCHLSSIVSWQSLKATIAIQDLLVHCILLKQVFSMFLKYHSQRRPEKSPKIVNLNHKKKKCAV